MAYGYEDDFGDLASDSPFEDDFGDLASDSNDFTRISQQTEDTFERTGLDALDDILGGSLSRQTAENLSDPNFDPTPPPPAYDRQAHMERAQRRNEFVADNPMEYEQVPLADKAIIGAGQGALDLVRAGAGLADAVFIPGARELATAAGDESAELDDLTTGIANQSLGSDFAQFLTRNLPSLVPGLAAAKLAPAASKFAAMYTTAGLQSAGSVFEDAQDGYLRQGMSEGEARFKSYGPAIIAGLLTAGITRGFGQTGVEALAGGLSRDRIREMLDEPLMSLIKGTGKEASEEALDQLAQGVLANITYQPEKTIGDIVQETLAAAAMGGILGGLGEGLSFATQKAIDQGRIEQGTDSLGRTPEFDPTRGNVDEMGQVIQPNVPNDFSDLAAEVPAEQPVQSSSSLRRGARGVKGAAAKIVESMGVSPETAQEFTDRWFASNPQYGSLEEMRTLLLNDFQAYGLEPETGRALYRDDLAQYLEMGMSEQEALATLEAARAGNDQAAQEARARNQAKLKAEIPTALRRELEQSEPTEAQKESGNYKKGHIKLDGMDITIENVAGSMRRGTDKGGNPWEVQMPADYGYVKGTKGKDGDHVDIYLGPAKDDPAAPVFVVDQVRDDGTFDEHKVLYGFADEQSALAAYDAAFSDGKGPQRRGAVTVMPKVEFKEWLTSGNTKKPVAYNKSSAPVSSPQETIEALRRAEAEGQVPLTLTEGGVSPEIQTQEGVQMPGVQEVASPAAVAEQQPATVPFTFNGKMAAPPNMPKGVVIPPVYLYTMTEDVGPLKKGSTVTDKSLIEAGLTIPPEMPSSANDPDAAPTSQQGAVTSQQPPTNTTDAAQPERSIDEQLEYESIAEKKQITADEMRRKELLEKKAGRKQKPVFTDLIDHIKDRVGKIQNSKKAKPGTEGYYGEIYKAAIKYGHVRSLFSSNGQSPDSVVDALRRDGILPEGATVDDLWEILERDARRRVAALKGGPDKESSKIDEMEAQRLDFEKEALTKRKGAKVLPADELFPGDELEIDGEKFVVKEFHSNGETGEIDFIEMEDGRRFGSQTVAGSMVIYADKDSYKPVPREDWIAEEEGQTENIQPLPTTMDAEGQATLDAGKGGKLKEIPGQAEAARQAQMRSEQATPLKADDIKIQKDMFGGKDPNAGDIPLFDQDQKSISNTGGGKPSRKREGRGTPSIEAMIKSSNLSARAKTVINEFLNTPLMRELDWDELRFELWDSLSTGTMGSRLGRLIKLSEADAEASTFPHEVAHILFDFLPFTYRSAIDAHRNSAMKKAFKGQIPAEFKRGMTSKEFQDGGYDLELYHLSNASEFLAHYVGDKFANDAFKNRNERPRVWTKIREWLEGMVDALRRSIGIKPDMDRVYREMLAGVWQPDLEAIVREEEQMSFSRTAREAQNAAALAKGEEKKIEASHQLAQAFDIVEFLNKHGAPQASAMAQRALQYFDYIGIRAAGVNLNEGVEESYRQLKERIVNPFQRNWLARLAAVHVANYEAHLKGVIEEGKKAVAKLTSPNFIKQMQRLAKFEALKDNTKLMDEVAGAMLEAAHKKALKALREEAKNDREIAELEGHLDEIDAAKKSSSAMSILMEDMVNVLAASPAGEEAMNNPNVTRAEFLRIYKDLKRSTGQPLFSENLMRWASFILTRNAELKEALWAAHLSRNAQIKAQMGPYEKRFLADLEKDPVATMRRELRAAKKRTTAFERARFAYLTLNKEVMSELGQLQSQAEAGDIAQNILIDEAWKAHRKEVFDDAQVEGTQKPFVAFTDKLLLLPSGREVVVDPQYMKGSQTQFESVYQDYKAAETELEEWLNSEANIDDPNYQIHRRNLTELQNYLTTISALRPSDTDRAFGYAMTIIRDAVKLAGGRMQDTVLKAVNEWNRVKEKSGWWHQRWSAHLMDARKKAITAHGIKFGSFRKNDIVAANQIWWKNVGNILHYSHNRQQGGFKVGDKLPSGWTVLKEDIEQLRLQSEAISAGFDVIKDFQITEDSLGKVGLFRKALKGSENMVRRIYNDGMLIFAENYSKARKGFQDAFRAGDESAQARFEQEMIGILNQNWGNIGFAFVWDRNADFAQNTIFDGEGNAFDVISKRMMANPNYIRNFDELLDELVSLTSDVSRDEAKEIVMVEFGRIINDWYQQAKDDSEGRMILPVRGKEAKNATTKSRNQALAPYAFYEYGFKDSRSIATFAGGLHSAPLDRVVSGMIAMETDLQRQLDLLRDQPDKTAAVKAGEQRRRNGETYDKMQSLEHRLKELRRTLESITSVDIDQDVDVSFGRAMGTATGILISSVTTTARNFTTGPLYIGQTLNRIHGASASNYLWGMWYAWSTGTQVFGSVGLSFLKGGGRAIIKVPHALNELAKGNFRGAYSIPMREFIEEVGSNAYTRIKTIKEMIDKNLIYLPDFKQEFINQIEMSAIYQGKIPAHELSGREKAFQTIPALIETTILAISKTFAPMAGDIALNAATYKAITRHASKDLDLRLRKLFDEWKTTQYRSFNFDDVRDPINVFSAKELFPKAPNRDKLFNDMRSAFAEAGMNFDELATRLFAELNAGNPRAKLFTEGELNNVAAKAMDDANRPSASGSPRIFQQNNFLINLLKPFMSWKVRSLQLFNRMLSIPGQSNMSRAALWSMVALFTLVPMLLINALMIQPGAEEIDRVMKKVLYNAEKSSRQPWERDGFKSEAIGWALNSTLGLPFVDMVANGMLNDLPVRASMLPEAAMLSKAQDINRYIGGVIQTGDPFFKLPELIGSFVPDTKAILNRLDSQSGKRLSSNSLALMRRHGDTELLREVGEPVAGVNYNELSPYGPKLENAAMNGDVNEFRRLFREAVQIAREKGRPDPEKAVRQLFSHRNPWDRAFKAKLTPAQRSAFLAKLSDGQREQIEAMERRFSEAAGWIGASFNTTKQDKMTASLGRGRSGRSTLASLSRTGGRSRGRRSVGLRRGRRNLGRRTGLRRGSRR